MAYGQAIKDKHLTENDEVVLIEPLVTSTEEEISCKELMKEQELVMTDTWKSKKQMKICSPSQSSPPTALCRSRLSTKLKKGPLAQNFLITTGETKSQKFTEGATISSSSKTSSNGGQATPVNLLKSPPVESTISSKKLKGEKETVEIKNGRTWKYANNFKPLVRRPLHPDLIEPTTANEPEEVSNSSSDSQKDSDKMEKYAVCPKCGNLSTDFQKCDSCRAPFSSNTKIYTRLRFKDADILKRKVPVSTVTSQQTPESVIKKQSFYGGNKYQEQYQVYANGGINAMPTNYKLVITAVTPVCQKPRTSRTKPQEPECLTISSDEEEHGTSPRGPLTTDSCSNPLTTRVDQRDCCLPDSTTGADNENSSSGGRSLVSYEEDSNMDLIL